MPFPTLALPFGGNLGAFTASIYRIDPFTGIPFEPLPDVVPGVTPLRVTIDCVDGESATYEYDVTEHAIQGLVDITTNVRRRLERLTIQGTLSGAPPLLPIDLGLDAPPLPPGLPSVGSIVRLDLMRFKNLKSVADARLPVMVVTPRVSLAKAFITSLSHSWGPDDGESTQVSIAFVEARIVSPLTGDIAVDYPAQTPGNNASGGAPAQANVGASASNTNATTGIPPSVGASP
jgi:hypothetical protein